MTKNLNFGLGLGLVLFPAVKTLEGLPSLGKYVTLIVVTAGVILLVKGYLGK